MTNCPSLLRTVPVLVMKFHVPRVPLFRANWDRWLLTWKEGRFDFSLCFLSNTVFFAALGGMWNFPRQELN